MEGVWGEQETPRSLGAEAQVPETNGRGRVGAQAPRPHRPELKSVVWWSGALRRVGELQAVGLQRPPHPQPRAGAFWNRRRPLRGGPSAGGGPSGCIPLGDLSSGTHLHALPLLWEVLGIWQLPRSTLPLNPALPPLPSQLLGLPVYGSSSPSPDLPKGAVMISSTRALG